MNRGALIVLEGCDCSGKTSQVKNIVKRLNDENIPAQSMCFPDRTTYTGKVIDSYLKKEVQISDQAMHLLFSANRWEVQPKIEDFILSGTTVIIDRYSYSGVAYSFAKKGALDLEWYKGPERGLPKPDLVLFLGLDPEVIKKRKGFGDELYEKTEFQESVAKAFHMVKDTNWLTIDANMSVSDLTESLLKQVIPVINNIKSKPLEKMW